MNENVHESLSLNFEIKKRSEFSLSIVVVLFLPERVDRRPRRCAFTNTSELFEQINLNVQRATVLRKQLINHLT